MNSLYSYELDRSVFGMQWSHDCLVTSAGYGDETVKVWHFDSSLNIPKEANNAITTTSGEDEDYLGVLPPKASTK